MSLRPGPHPVKHGRLAGTSSACIPPATRLSHGNKRSQYFHPQPGFLTGTSAVSISLRNPAFSREQARSAPRAHVRELLCETQSSKEQLRRSRTESSEAPPATEELAGEARQVRPARAACGSVSTDFGLLTGEEVWRATGPPAPASNIPARKFSIPPPHRPRTAEVGISRHGTALAHPGRSEGDRPSSTHGIIPARKFRLSSPIPPAHRRSRKTKTAPFRK